MVTEDHLGALRATPPKRCTGSVAVCADSDIVLSMTLLILKLDCKFHWFISR